MLLTLLLVFCVLGGSLALEENEWRDAAVALYYKITTYFGQHDHNKFLELFCDGGEDLFPNGPLLRKGEMKPSLHTVSLASEYMVAFLKLLYSSPDMAVTRHVGYRKEVDGTVKKFKGLLVLVRENGEVCIKMGAYNSNSDNSA